MDVAYDHVQEEALSPSPSNERKPSAPSAPSDSTTPGASDPSSSSEQTQSSNLNTEFQQAFKAVQSSPWGTTIGGWFSSARKQGETFYQDLQKEATEAQEQATKGFSSLREQVVNRTRSLSLGGEAAPEQTVPGEEAVPVAAGAEKSRDAAVGAGAAAEAEAMANQPESLPADIVKEAGSLVASLRSTAASRLKDLQRAEDAADEALLKFGTNVRNFLRDAVVITAPDTEKDGKASEVLFETSEPGTGKKVFHSTRLDAQLHAIHTTATSFTDDPAQGEAWEQWSKDFDIDSKTNVIAADLDKYEELRRAMEKLVPEKVEYKAFWMRYYFLRSAVEEDERKRREVLKGTASSRNRADGFMLMLTIMIQAPPPRTRRTLLGTTTMKTTIPRPTRPPHLRPPRSMQRPRNPPRVAVATATTSSSPSRRGAATRTKARASPTLMPATILSRARRVGPRAVRRRSGRRMIAMMTGSERALLRLGSWLEFGMGCTWMAWGGGRERKTAWKVWALCGERGTPI